MLCTTGSLIFAADQGLVEVSGGQVSELDQADPCVQLKEQESGSQVTSSVVTSQSATAVTKQTPGNNAQPAVLPLVSPVSVGAGESVVLGVIDAQRVAVADPSIADIVVVSRYEVLVTGRAPGQTTLHIWDKTGLQKLDVQVFENTAALMQDFYKRLGLPGVEAWMHQGTVVLEGVVETPVDRERAVQLAGAYGRVVDLLSVAGGPHAAAGASSNTTSNAMGSAQPSAPAQGVLSTEEVGERLAELGLLVADPNLNLRYVQGKLILDGSLSSSKAQQRAQQLAQVYFTDVVDVTTIQDAVAADDGDLALEISNLIDRPDVLVRLTGNKIILEGTLRDQLELERALKLAESYGREVIHTITFSHPLQVALKVHVLEVNRSGAKDLGVTWGTQNPGPSVIDANNYYFGEVSLGGAFTRLMAIGAKVRAITESGNGKLLAAPTLVTLNNKAAQFLAGGEVPVITPQADGALSTQYHTYGVKLHVTPEITAQGYVIVHIEPEVSTLDWANGVQVSGISIPAFRTRRTQTSVLVKDGDTLVLGGLLNQDDGKQIAKVPLLGNLPVIGQLFRSETFSKGETELLFLVTPQILVDGAGPTPEAVVSPGTLTVDGRSNTQSADVLQMLP